MTTKLFRVSYDEKDKFIANLILGEFRQHSIQIQEVRVMSEEEIYDKLTEIENDEKGLVGIGIKKRISQALAPKLIKEV